MRFISGTEAGALRAHLDKELEGPVTLDLFIASKSAIVVPGQPECELCEETRELLEDVAVKTLTIGGAVFLLLWAGGTPVEAQDVASSFDQLTVLVKPGDKISVVDLTGRTTDGRIATLSRDALTLVTEGVPRWFGESDVAQIRQRRNDSLKNGAIIGAVAGAAYFVTAAALFTTATVAT